MRISPRLILGLLVASLCFAQTGALRVGPARALAAPPGTNQGEKPAAAAPQYVSVKFQDAKWEKILPDFGDDSPEIAILRVDPKTQATQLLIRNHKAIHVTRHWHSANETHTVLRGTIVFECDGKRDTLAPSSFNYIPRKMIHQAWLPDDSMVFITVDGAWDVNWVDGPPQPPKKP